MGDGIFVDLVVGGIPEGGAAVDEDELGGLVSDVEFSGDRLGEGAGLDDADHKEGGLVFRVLGEVGVDPVMGTGGCGTDGAVFEQEEGCGVGGSEGGFPVLGGGDFLHGDLFLFRVGCYFSCDSNN